jgi:hypothetical protein
MYDIFYILKEKSIDPNLEKLKIRFPLLKVVTYAIDKSEAVYKAQKRSTTRFFWLINLDIDYQIVEDFKFDYDVPEWDQTYVHVWNKKNNLNEPSIDNLSFDDVFLIPKKYTFSKRELSHLFFINKKEIPQIASSIRRYDIVFISYFEPNADKNWENLLDRYPMAKRVNGVNGIHQAHIQAAMLSETSMFWVIDGDAQLVKDFNLDYIVDPWDKDSVFVWKSKNPINNLIYGYGGVKLLPKELTLKLDIFTVDMTTSISNKFNSKNKISNITAFNTDPFNTWKSAFRECVKLSSRSINGQIDQETIDRLSIWCTIGIDNLYGEYAIKGAVSGKEFGLKYSNDRSMLAKINDWKWLEDEFNKL